ncbi:MAG: acyl--CoA ligase [Desulfobacter sp.]|nr:MAG: acyl--CoA ligase [Desulfobacter sp.]
MQEKILSEIAYDPSWGIRPTLEAEPMTTYEMFHKNALLYPSKPALIFLDNKISYSQLDTLVDRFASALFKLGIKKGDRVGALLPNCPQHVIAFLAANRLGAIHVPANVMYEGEELKHILTDSGMKLVITLDLFYENLCSVMEGTDVQKVIVTGIDDFLAFPKSMLYRLKTRFDGTRVKVGYGEHTLSFMNLLKTGGSFSKRPDIDFDDTMLILYTAGTTGKSKGVMLTHRNFVYNAGNQAENFDMTSGNVNLVLFPMFHISGQ